MKTTTMFFVIIGFLLAGCTTEGPMGPEGVPGRDGLDTEIYYSPWYEPQSWLGSAGDWYFGINSTAISENIVETGVILAYMSVPKDLGYEAAVRPMPAYALGANWEFIIPDYGKIEFMTDAQSVPGTKGYFFRFVLIPSNIKLKAKGFNTSVEELKSLPYEDVCSKLGIPE